MFRHRTPKSDRLLAADISRPCICLLRLAFLTDFAAVSCLDVVRHGTFAAARNIVFVRWFQARFRCQVDNKVQGALDEQERERHRIFPQNSLDSVA